MADTVVIRPDRERADVAVVTINRPDQLNAMNADLIEGLHAVPSTSCATTGRAG